MITAWSVALLQAGDGLPLPTTLNDFFMGGSQPDGGYDQIISSSNCGTCHGAYDDTIHIQQRWEGSMMAQSARDPLFYACLTIAEQDAAFVGDLCIRCHVPRAWILGRSSPTDGSEINESDLDGVNCHFCHRMVDPFYVEGVSPIEDDDILNDLLAAPVTIGGGNYVLDPFDRRRGKREEVAPPHSFLVSPFHEDSNLCGTCHDVSNPAYTRQPDGTYALNDLDTAHPTDNKFDQFPMERTFSEWANSEYAAQGVDAGGRFGGNKTVVSTCQDCHMPDTTSKACGFEEVEERTDMASHDFAGANAWVPDMIINLYAEEDNVNVEAILAGKQRAIEMVQRAATLEVTQSGDSLNVRVINETGHKLPSGYSEGRRMWVNVQFFDEEAGLIDEKGGYDFETADLDSFDTEVFEMKMGIDQAIADLTGLTVGEGFHFAINNVIYKDNRIPPRGFTQSAFAAVQAAPAAATYLDGQHWDDTLFVIPVGAASATVNLYYQTSSRDYIEFLRDENHTNEDGQTVYDQWLITGKSPPVLMVAHALPVESFGGGDFDFDGDLDLFDYADFNACFTGPGAGPVAVECQPGDLDGDNDIDLADFGRWQRRYSP